MIMLKNIIHRWIEFILRKPVLTLVTLAIITIGLGSGVRKLQFDSSTEFLMPKNEPLYLVGEKIKSAFLNNKTLVISSIEAAPGKTLFSKEVFSYLNLLVEEIEEYKDFDLALENSRLHALLQSGSITIEKMGAPIGIASAPEKQTPMEDDLDALILGDGASDTKIEDVILDSNKPNTPDLWDTGTPVPSERFVKAIRERNIYNYNAYHPITLTKIRSAMDAKANRQLDTILITKEMDSLDPNIPLEQTQFKAILEGWEDLYLFKSMSIVQSFMNPITGEDITGANNELKAVAFIQKKSDGTYKIPESKEDFIEYQRKIHLNPMNKTLLYSLDKDQNVQALGMSVVLRSIEHYNVLGEYYWAMLSKYDKSPIVMHSYGSLIIERFMTYYMRHDLGKLVPLVFLIVILTFFLNFRNIRGVALPMLTVLVGAIWTMGAMGHLGVKMSMLVSILPPLLIAIGSSYSIHMFNQYMQDLEHIHAKNKIGALLHSMAHISITVFLASFTTFISFMTLSVNQVTSLRDFGVFAGLGAIFSMLVSFLLIPASLSLLKPLPFSLKQKEIQGNRILDRMMTKISWITTEKSKITTIIFSIIFIAGVVGLTKVKPETSPIYNFNEGSYIRNADTKISDLFNGSFSINLVLDSGKNDGALDPVFLSFIEELRTWLDQDFQKDEYNILINTSFGDFIKRMNMAMNGDRPEFYTIPNNETTIRDYMEILSGDDINSDGRVDSFEQFVDNDFRRVNLVIRTGSYKGKISSTEVNKKIKDHVESYIASLPNPNHYSTKIGGDGLNFAILADYIINGQILSIILSLIIIGILVYVLFNSFLAALLSLIPIALGISVVYGMMGYLGIPLDIPKAILSSIAIGIGIDDTIHFMKTLAHFLQQGNNLKDAIYKTHKEAGLAIIYTSIALIFGFAILMVSNFRPVFFLGFLVGSVMLTTTVGALIALPAVIKLTNLKIKDIDIDDAN